MANKLEPARMIAALFVMPNGPYFNREGVDPWDERRDAFGSRVV